MKKFTKIVSTIGPATETEEVLEQLINAGMNVARFNTKHSEPAWHEERIERVKKVSEKCDTPVAVLLDLQGPEIRINVPSESFEVKKGDIVHFTSNKDSKEKNVILVPADVVSSLEKNNDILLDDGACEFNIIEKGADFLAAQAVGDCTVKHRKTMNTPGVVLDMPSLTDRDIDYIKNINPKHVDFVALSFARDKRDLDILKSTLTENNFHAQIVAKIENQAALDNLDELIANADAVMVARGDLGVEVPYEELIYWQKQIISRCRRAAKPVITATQMLKSMIDSPRPTRAEVSDVAHAIYDSTDAIMLSEETTIGKYPVKSVETQARISAFNEKHNQENVSEQFMHSTKTSIIAESVVHFAQKANGEVKAIVCLTKSGSTPKFLSRHRLNIPIYALTADHHVASTLSLSYAVQPVLIKSKDLSKSEVLKKLKDDGFLMQGDVVLFTHSTDFQLEVDSTNTVSVITV